MTFKTGDVTSSAFIFPSPDLLLWQKQGCRRCQFDGTTILLLTHFLLLTHYFTIDPLFDYDSRDHAVQEPIL